MQLRQSELDAPVQVPQEASHAWQTCELSAYLPMGVHEARQREGEVDENGLAAAHVRQSPSPRSEQVAHDA